MADDRERAIRRVLRCLKALMNGQVLERNSAGMLMDVSPPHAHRMLRVIEEELPGVVPVGKRGEGYRFDVTRFQPVSFPVAIAACFGRTLADLFGETIYAENLRRTADDAIQRCRRSKEFKDLDRKFVFLSRGGDPSVTCEGGVLDAVIDGVLRSQKIQMIYKSGGAALATWRTVHPLSLIIADHQFYLVARDGPDCKVYRLSRIERVCPTDEVFSYPRSDRFDPRLMFEDTIGVYRSSMPLEHIRIKLTGEWADVARSHVWHHSQRVEEYGAYVLVQWRLRQSKELHSLILSFGSQVEVLEPQDLRSLVAMEAARCAQNHGHQT